MIKILILQQVWHSIVKIRWVECYVFEKAEDGKITQLVLQIRNK